MFTLASWQPGRKPTHYYTLVEREHEELCVPSARLVALTGGGYDTRFGEGEVFKTDHARGCHTCARVVC